MAIAGPALQRTITAASSVAIGVAAVPIAATFLDGQGTENWILPAQVAATTAAGAGLGAIMPGIAKAGADGLPNALRGRGAAVGALIGAAGAIVADAAWFGLLAG